MVNSTEEQKCVKAVDLDPVLQQGIFRINSWNTALINDQLQSYSGYNPDRIVDVIVGQDRMDLIWLPHDDGSTV
jgi:hypothetical protein